MYLSTVEIENFRNLAACTLRLQPGLNVLVGRNNVGKSNAVAAIRHALGSAAAAGDLPHLDRTDFHDDQDGNPLPIRVTLRFAGLSDQDRINFFELLIPNLADIAESEARVVFEATWGTRDRPNWRRWCGPELAEGASVPHALLAALRVTFLPALRNAEAALTPGYKNRLARVLQVLATDEAKSEVMDVFKDANDALESQQLIKDTVDDVRGSAERMAGADFETPSIRAVSPDVSRVFRTLRLTLDDAPVEDIASTGLGYQNILYVATVLVHLTNLDERDVPLLIVEEPEAHLHPQLVVLLAESLSEHRPGHGAPQTIVTTHSPTFAANVEPRQIVVMVADDEGCGTAGSLAVANLDEKEARAIQRLMDVTRSALYFARGMILVEGISEALLVPALANRLGLDLQRRHVSVIPLCGVAFPTLAKLLDPTVLDIPVAIISDGDPTTVFADDESKDWRTARSKSVNGSFEVCARLTALRTTFKEHSNVDVFGSRVTLEYDLAAAGEANPGLMAQAWESTFIGTPRTLTQALVNAATSHDEAALAVWRGICVARSGGSKADFAHRLSAALLDEEPGFTDFVVPGYLEAAIRFACGVDATPSSPVADDGE